MIRLGLGLLKARWTAAPALQLLSTLGVTAGVASVLCVLLLSSAAVGSFKDGLRAVRQGADLVVTGRGAPLEEERLVDVLATPGVAAAWPMARLAVAIEDGGEAAPEFLELVGVDLYASTRLPLQDASGAGPGSADGAARLAEALETPGWVAVSPQLAERRGWRAGSRIQVSAGSRRAELVVGALVDFQAIAPLASEKLAAMDLATLQDALGRHGVLDEVSVTLAEGASLDEVQARLRDRLGSGVEVAPPEQKEQDGEDLLGAFRLNLMALSSICHFVGLFLVYATTQASLVRRRRELGTLRALGATPRQVLSLILAEVGGSALVGVAVGLPLGWAAAAGNLATVSGTLADVYQLGEVEALSVEPWILVAAATVGVLGALLGALFPALDLSRRDSRALLSASGVEDQLARLAGPLAWAGVGTMAFAGLAGAALFGHWKGAGFVLATGVLAGTPLLAPAALRGLARRVPVRGFGPGFSLRALATRPSAAAAAVAGLAVATAMAVGVTVMVTSFRSTLDSWVTASVRADVYVTTRSWQRAQAAAHLDAELVEVLRTHPGVAAVDRLRRFQVEAAGRKISVAGVDMQVPHAQARFQLYPGHLPDAYSRWAAGDGALIGEPLARGAGLGPGDRLTMRTPGGPAQLEVLGVYRDYGSPEGSAALSMQKVRQLFGPAPVQSVALYLEPGEDAEQVVDALRARLPEAPLWIRSNRRMRTEIFTIFDRTFALTRLLQLVAVLVAVCGVVLALLVLTRERAGELALYRAMGATPGAVFRFLLTQGLAIAALGLALGVAAGAALAWILVHAVNPAFFGWTLALSWPLGEIAGQAAAVMLASALAAAPAAWRARDASVHELAREDR